MGSDQRKQLQDMIRKMKKEGKGNFQGMKK